MKSILQDYSKGTCYLCELIYMDRSRKSTQEHHIFEGTANRRMSEKYGAKVRLCFYHHGSKGREDVHRPDLNKNGEYLKIVAQTKLEREMSREEFISIFGKSWIGEEHVKQDNRTGGIRFLQDEEAMAGSL